MVPLVENELRGNSFAYIKTNESFIKKAKEFEQEINIPYSTASIVYNEAEETVQLLFNCYCNIRLPKYEKWYEKNLGEKIHFSYPVNHIRGVKLLEFEDFSQDDFYEPSSAVKFKRAMAAALSGAQDEFVYLDEVAFVEELGKVTIRFEELSNYEKLLAKIEYPLDPVWKNLHVYLGNAEIAASLYKEAHSKYISLLKNRMDSSYLEAFEKVINHGKKLLRLELGNPFQAKVDRLADNSGTLDLTSGFQYQSKEVFRGVNSKIIAGLLNEATGDRFIFLENKTAFKIAKDGEVVFRQQIETGAAFDYHLWSAGLKLVDNSNCLFLGKYILKDNNELADIEKTLKSEIKQKHKVNFTINSALFEPENEQYILLCSYNHTNSIIAYFDKSFEYIGEVFVGGIPVKIFPRRKWVIIDHGQHAFYNFSGEKIFELKYGNGNTKIELSNQGEYSLSFGYSPKSDLYGLSSFKSKVLWAHPTFVKDYKEILYNDTHHNFDLSIASFAPDDTYIVGGGYHGKYVAWKLPKLERFELIPGSRYLPLFKDAEVVELGNTKFLKNRSDLMSNIKFFNNSNNFLTQLGDKNLIWDKDFNNTGMLPVKGKINLLSQKYVTVIEDDAFYVYERI